MLFIFTTLFAAVSASLSAGWCPSVQIQKNFDMDRYKGIWYQEVRDKDIIYENGRCNVVEYTKVDKNTMKIINSELKGGKWNHILSTAISDSTDGQFYQRFFEVSPQKDYKIVLTDYENISIVYTCTSYLVFHVSYAWVLTRNLGSINLEPYIKLLQSIGNKKENIFHTSNENCSQIY